MMYWLAATEQDASTLEQAILKLGSRALALRDGYERDDSLNVIGRNLKTGATGGPATTNWSVPRETVDGQWAIASPSSNSILSDTYTDAPAVLAVGWGLDPAAVGWGSVVVAANANGATLDADTFNPAAEYTMPGLAWVAGAAAVLGITYTEALDPAFPESPAP